MNNREARKLFKFKKFDEGYSIVEYRGSEREVIIPAQYRKKAVMTIETAAFFDKIYDETIESITIPSTVVKIKDSFRDVKIKVEEENATYEVINNCLIEKATKKVISGGKDSVIPEGVKKIGERAFYGTSIESITIPSTVEEIESEAFDHCIILKTVTLNEGLKEIGKNAFFWTPIESITIPRTVEKVDSPLGDAKIKVIDGNAKYEVINNCLIEEATKKLISGGKYSVMPNGVKEICDSAFEGTTIETITTPSTVEEIGYAAFCHCINLKTVTLNEGLKRIGAGAFMYTSIETIIIPSTVEKIEDSIFSRCDNIKTVILKEGLKSIERNAFWHSQIKTITIPSTVGSIGDGAFEWCRNLKSVTLNEGLKEIGIYAFSGTSIESITIPSTVEGIGFNAFSGCSKLTRIDCKLSKGYVKLNSSKFRGLLDMKSIINWLNG